MNTVDLAKFYIKVCVSAAEKQHPVFKPQWEATEARPATPDELYRAREKYESFKNSIGVIDFIINTIIKKRPLFLEQHTFFSDETIIEAKELLKNEVFNDKQITIEDIRNALNTLSGESFIVRYANAILSGDQKEIDAIVDCVMYPRLMR